MTIQGNKTLIFQIISSIILIFIKTDLLTAQTTAKGKEVIPPSKVTIVSKDYHYECPDTILSGPTLLEMVNEGPDMHHITLVRFEEGYNLSDFMSYMSTNKITPSWTTEVGGPVPPDKIGARTSTIVDLRPGNYALVCFINTKDPQPHFMKGMIHPLTVLPQSNNATLPHEDLILTLDDYSFVFSRKVTRGKKVIKIENKADQPHEVAIIHLKEGKTIEDFLSYIRKPEGEAPATIEGGTSPISPGEINHIEINFKPGRYGLICFYPDKTDGKSHLSHGMMDYLEVR